MKTCRPPVLASMLLLVSLAMVGWGEAGPPDYRIGPGDVLTISVWDNKDLDQTVFVRPDGKISLPLLGEVHAGDVTVAELAARLSEMYSKTVKGAQVMVGVQEIRSRAVFFVGGVAKAGLLQLTQDITLIQAISLVGGLVPGAAWESVFILRGEKLIPVDVVKLIQKADLRQNIKLEPGDTVVVPFGERVVYVQGEVKNPGLIKFTEELTILKAIAQAGGFTSLAASRRVSLLREDGAKREKIQVDVYQVMNEPDAAPDTPLKPNDLVIVPQRTPGVLPGG